MNDIPKAPTRVPTILIDDERPDAADTYIAIITAPYREEIVGNLYRGAVAEVEKLYAKYERIDVTGALEIPGTVAQLESSDIDYFDAYICLGCIIKGETIHDEVIAYTAFSSLDRLATEKLVAVGNGILTVNSEEQALERSDPDRMNRGAEAAKAALRMMQLKRRHGN